MKDLVVGVGPFQFPQGVRKQSLALIMIIAWRTAWVACGFRVRDGCDDDDCICSSSVEVSAVFLLPSNDILAINWSLRPKRFHSTFRHISVERSPRYSPVFFSSSRHMVNVCRKGFSLSSRVLVDECSGDNIDIGIDGENES